MSDWLSTPRSIGSWPTSSPHPGVLTRGAASATRTKIESAGARSNERAERAPVRRPHEPELGNASGGRVMGDIASRQAETDAFGNVETHGIEAIPTHERHGQPRELAFLWGGAFVNYASLFTASLLTTYYGLGVWDGLAATAIGTVAAAVILGLLSNTGPRSGLPQIVFTRRIFGLRGSYLGAALTLFLAIGWVAVDCVIAAQAGGLLGVFGLLAPPTHLPTASTQGVLGVFSAPAPAWVAIPFFVFIVVGEICANYLDVYTAGLVTLAMGIKLKRWQTALGCGILGTALAAYAVLVSDFHVAYEDFLILTYLWAPAWAAVVLLSFFVFEGKGRPVLALVAWLAGTATSLVFVNYVNLFGNLGSKPSFFNAGLIAGLHGADLSGFISVGVAAAGYWVGRRIATT